MWYLTAFLVLFHLWRRENWPQGQTKEKNYNKPQIASINQFPWTNTVAYLIPIRLFQRFHSALQVKLPKWCNFLAQRIKLSKNRVTERNVLSQMNLISWNRNNKRVEYIRSIITGEKKDCGKKKSRIHSEFSFANAGVYLLRGLGQNLFAFGARRKNIKLVQFLQY